MIDIFIKSFDRPYYVERALKSIKQNISGKYKITLLDDGTNKKYLNKLKTLFPDINLQCSQNAISKSKEIDQYISNDLPIKTKGIPFDLWKESIAKASKNFVLLTDDTWIYNKINLDLLNNVMDNYKINSLKFLWLGNSNLVQGTEYHNIEGGIELIEPLVNNNVLNTFYGKLLLKNTFKIKSILIKMGGLNRNYRLKYYTLYTVGGAFFNKMYWLYLWQNAGASVNENMQLTKALEWYKNKSKTNYAKTNVECMRTSFSSSATNMFTNIKFNTYAYNYYLNEAWFKGELDSMDNYPKDISENTIVRILNKSNDERCKSENWKLWMHKFKQIYREQGCDVDYSNGGDG